MSKTRIIILIGAIVTASAIGILINMYLNRKKIKKAYPEYMERFQKNYKETRDIKQTIDITKEEYPKKSLEYKTLAKAYDYLNNSIMKDYKTAFSFIEKIYENELVNEMHMNCISNEINKITLMITQKNNI